MYPRGLSEFYEGWASHQELLIAAWTDFTKGSPPADPAKFTEQWMNARRAALAKAGLTDTF